jgi:hypothetical protein
MCGFMAIAASATFVVASFSVHETAYKREIVNYDLPESDITRKEIGLQAFLSLLAMTLKLRFGAG